MKRNCSVKLTDLRRQSDRAIDVACGPGRWRCDLRGTCVGWRGWTSHPRFWAARGTRRKRRVLQTFFLYWETRRRLPFADGSLEVAVTSYSLHHVPEPQRVVAEMARALARGGRAGVLDMIVPEEPRAAELRNRIEIARDPSHTRAMPTSELEKMFAAAGLRVIASQEDSKARSFDHWLSVAGWKRGDAAYQKTRGLLEKSMREGKDSGFHPKLLPAQSSGGIGDIELKQTSAFVVGEKI